MTSHDAILRRLEDSGQRHLAAHAETLGDAAREAFFAQLADVDWELLDRLVALTRVEGGTSKPTLEPAPSIRRHEDVARDDEARARGEELLKDGKVAVFVVAGGQGSRLGFDGPKGLYPVTPIAQRCLFRVFAEKISALSQRFDQPVPWYVMTSRTNHDATVAAFEDAGYWGLEASQVTFFSQDMLPAVDEEGRLVLAEPGHLFMSPNGHGGSLLALRKSGALDAMRERGIEQIFYFQVDNPLVAIADPVFLGYHDLAGAQMSTKTVPKRDAAEKVGVVGLVDGRYGVIEYSDLSEEERQLEDESGALRFRDGNIAVHALRRDFVESITADGLDLPYHLARKAMSALDPVTGEATKLAGIKFETFVFDALARCERSVVLSVDRAEEFAPVKNAEGEDSPATSRAAQIALFARWLEAAGVTVPRGDRGEPAVALEISPLFADDARAVAERAAEMTIDGDTLFDEA